MKLATRLATAAAALALGGVAVAMLTVPASATTYEYYQRSKTFGVSGGSTNGDTVTCDTTTDEVVGGGVEFDNPGTVPNPSTYMRVTISAPASVAGKDAWAGAYYNANSGGASLTGRIYVICAEAQ